MSGLSVQLLGGFTLTFDDQEVKALRTERLILLLAYLLLHSEKPIPRKKLAFTFWPDTTEEQARTNLRNLFHHLRKAFPEIDSFLTIEGQSIQWKKNTSLDFDVAIFKVSVIQAKNTKTDAERITYLNAAVNYYRGELLPGYYEDWLLAQREEIQQAYIQSLAQLAKLYEEARQYNDAIEITRRLIQSEPLNEDAYQLSMRLHALNNDRAGAMQVYHACINVMRRELDIEPSVETKNLYEQLVRSVETPTAGIEQEKVSAEIKLVGRRQEWGQLKEAWYLIQKKRACMVILRGESGIGKTRLSEEISTWVQRQGFFSATARAYPAEGELAYGAVTLWLSSLSTKHLSDIWKTEVSRLLPELLDEKISAPGALTEVWQQQRFHEGLARAALGSQPLLLILDDIQWADRKTLEWLRFLFRFDPQARLMILATARNEDIPAEGFLHELIDSLRQAGQYTEISLPRFSKEETTQLAEQISKTKLPAETITALQKQTEGLPLFVVELTRSGLNLDDTTGASLPDRLLVALKERLSTLTDLSRNAVETAAIIGHDFTAEFLARAAELNEAGLLGALDELWRRNILRESERGRYDFSHDKLREFIYNSLSPARRQLLHRHIAQALTELEPDDFWGCASHLEKSGSLREASNAYFTAAKREAEQASYSAAQNGLKRALDLIDEKEIYKRAELLTELARVCDITGEQEQASQAVEEALKLTAGMSNHIIRSQALTAAANIALQKGQLDDARTWFEMALEITKKLDDKTHEIKLLLLVADTELRAGKAQEARTRYEQALGLARQTKNYTLEAEALQDMGFILPSIGESMSTARKYFEDSLKLRRMLGDRLGEARTLCNLTAFLHASGLYEETLILGKEALEKNRAVNYRRGAAIVSSSQGLAAYELGQFEQARILLEGARTEYNSIGEQDGYGLSISSLGLVAMAEGKLEESEVFFKEALAIAEEHQTTIFAAFTQQDLGTLYGLQGRWQEAEPYFEKALATHLENGDTLGISYDQTMLGHIHIDAGDFIQADQLADEVMAKFRAEVFEGGGVIRWLWQFKGLLESLNREEETAEVLEKAKEVFKIAVANIQNKDLRRSFIENFTHHQELQ